MLRLKHFRVFRICRVLESPSTCSECLYFTYVAMVYLVTKSAFPHTRAKSLYDLTLAYQFRLTSPHSNRFLYHYSPYVKPRRVFLQFPLHIRHTHLCSPFGKPISPFVLLEGDYLFKFLRICSYLISPGKAFRSLPDISDFPHPIPVEF